MYNLDDIKFKRQKGAEFIKLMNKSINQANNKAQANKIDANSVLVEKLNTPEAINHLSAFIASKNVTPIMNNPEVLAAQYYVLKMQEVNELMDTYSCINGTEYMQNVVSNFNDIAGKELGDWGAGTIPVNNSYTGVDFAVFSGNNFSEQELNSLALTSPDEALAETFGEYNEFDQNTENIKQNAPFIAAAMNVGKKVFEDLKNKNFDLKKLFSNIKEEAANVKEEVTQREKESFIKSNLLTVILIIAALVILGVIVGKKTS